MSYAAEGNKHTAQRIINAHSAFINTLMEIGNITREKAIAVKEFYLKNKLAKMDAIIGRISVKHGAYLDMEVIQRAAEKPYKFVTLEYNHITKMHNREWKICADGITEFVDHDTFKKCPYSDISNYDSNNCL